MNDRELLARIVEGSEDAIVSASLDGLITSWNRGAERLFGYMADEVIGRSFRTIAAPEHREPMSEVLRRTAAGERVPPYEAIRRRKDGTSIPVSVTVAPIHDGSARLVGLGAIIRDNREEIAAREALLLERERLATSQRVARIGSWEWVLASDTVSWSQEFYRIVGVDPETFTTSLASFLSCVHPEDRDRVAGTVQEALGGHGFQLEYRLLRPDGSVRVVDGRGEVALAGESSVVRMYGTLQDVTERRAIEDELDRQQELAKRGAASAELLSRASHELRTPLNAILGFSELLEQRLEPVLGPRERRYLQNIRGSGRQLLELIDRLLQLSKADSGRLRLERSVVGLASLVEPVAADVAAAAAAAQVEVAVAPLPEASVRVDIEQLAIVLRELLRNAVAATPPGGSVRLGAAVPDGDLVLEVADTGRGIPRDAHDRVFDVFERIHDDASSAGTGLGLALCRDLVELHGGTIAFESEPGHGTTFRIRIPHAAWRRQDGERVLVVEDDPNDADLVMTICADAGIRCEVVGTVGEALASIGQGTPRAAVVDLHLPDGSGRQIVAALRGADAELPVLVVTADGESPPTARRGEYLKKPVDPERLRAWLLAAAAAKVPA